MFLVPSQDGCRSGHARSARVLFGEGWCGPAFDPAHSSSIEFQSSVTRLSVPIEDLINNPRIVRALWWSTLVDEGTMRAWLVSSGRRQANRQMAHLFCELLARLEAVGLADEGNSTFPSRRRISGIYLELQQVHGNKTLKALRENGLVTIPDPTRMAEFAEFDPLYLHLRKRHTQKSVAPSAYLADRA